LSLVGTSEGGRTKEKGEGGEYVDVEILCTYENGTVRPVEIILRKTEGIKENAGWDVSN
jgi:hypothetical protein